MGKYREFIENTERYLSPLAIKSEDAVRIDGSKVDLDDDKNLERGYRTPFQLDRDRILYSKYFDLLARKTQIFIASEKELLKNGPFRNRLTHTQSCSVIARSIAQVFHLNEHLVEAIALGHDIGHTPFGHIGEDFLKGITSGLFEGSFQPFQHGMQGLRLLTFYQGENLTKQVAYGIARHSLNCKDNASERKLKGTFWNIGQERIINFELDSQFSCFETQIVRIADDISWICDDYRDALGSELITESQLIEKIKSEFHTDIYIKILSGNLYTYFVNDIIETNLDNFKKLEQESKVVDMPWLNNKFYFSKQAGEIFEFLKKEIENKIHKHTKIDEKNKNKEKILNDIYKHYFKIRGKKDMSPELEKDLPPVIKRMLASLKGKIIIKMQQLFCDYISMLSDDDLQNIHERITTP